MKVGFIGAGKMGEAILAALIRRRMARPDEIVAADTQAVRRRRMKRRHGIRTTARNRSVLDACRIVFLAVKPQDLGNVLKELEGNLTSRHLLISIAAGKTSRWIESRAGRARVVRVMPNLPCVVGEGMSAFCGGKRARPADRRTVRRLLSSFGEVLELPENRFDAVTAVSGLGPAFSAYVLARFAEGGVREGLSRDEAQTLALQTMLGTARLLSETGLAPSDLIASVASRKGTTVAGLAVLEGHRGTAAALRGAVRAAARRSRELRK